MEKNMAIYETSFELFSVAKVTETPLEQLICNWYIKTKRTILKFFKNHFRTEFQGII